MSIQRIVFKKGQAALIAVMFFLFVSLVVLGTFAAIGVSKLAASNELLISRKAYATSESAIEDATYRMGVSTIADHALNTTYDVPLNNGNARVTISDADGNVATADYRVSVTGQVASRYRNTSAVFSFGGDGPFSVSVQNPVQTGYLGLHMYANTIVNSSQGPGLGSVFSNGSIVAESGSPSIDGTAIVAKGIANSPSISVGASITSANADTVTIGKDYSGNDKRIDGAQSFVPKITANITQISLFIKPVGGINASLPIKIYANRRVNKDGSACSSSSTKCYDAPALSGIVNSGNISTSDLDFNNGGTYKWVTVPLNYAGATPVIMNEKYWITFDTPCSLSGCLGGSAGWALGSDLTDNYDADPEYYSVPDAYQDKVWSFEGPEPGFLLMNNINSVTFPDDNCYADVPNLSPMCFRSQDIAFKVYLGETQTRIDGIAAAGSFNIAGDARAELLRGIDVGGIAYYNDGSLDTVSTEEVIAGATKKNLVPPTPSPATLGSGSSQCYVKTRMVGGSSDCTAPWNLQNPTVFNQSCYCGCWQRDRTTSYCQYMDPLASDPDQPPSAKDIGPFGFDFYRRLRKKAASLGTTTPGNITLGSGTTTFPGPAYHAGVIDGDLTVINSAIVELSGLATNTVSPNVTSGKCQYNESNGAVGKPCYVLRITGDLTVKNNAIIRPTHCPAPCNNPNTVASVYIIVDGNVNILNNAQLYGMPTGDGRSGMFVTSYSPDISPPYAIDLNNNTSGSVFYAFRGGVLIENNLLIKAVAAPYIKAINNAVVTFDSGLINPYSEDGGPQAAAGVSFSDFRETE